MLFRSVCSLLGIDKTRTTAYHPASDGLVERFNQTLERGLAHYVSMHHRDWDTKLAAFLLGYRSTPQTSTGYSPSYLLFGRELCLPQDLAFGLPPGEDSNPPVEFVATLRNRLEDAHKVVRERLSAVHRYQAHIHDAHAKAFSFELGQSVWLLVPSIPVGTSAKFAKLWSGPHTVEDKLSDVVYRIKSSSNPPCFQIVHVNRLKLCRHRPHRLTEIRESQDAIELPSALSPPPIIESAKDADPDDADDSDFVFQGGRFPRTRRAPDYFGNPIKY